MIDLCLTEPAGVHANVGGGLQEDQGGGHWGKPAGGCSFDASGLGVESTHKGWDVTAARSATIGTLIDMNGDSIPDYIVGSVTGEYMNVYYGLGDGRFLTTAASGERNPTFLHDDTNFSLPKGVRWEVRSSDIAEWMSDYRARQLVEICEPGGISCASAIRGLPYMGYADSGSWWDLFDVNGDGTPDRVVVDSTTGGWNVYLNEGPEGLLETVTNELGGVTTIVYQVGSEFGLGDSADFGEIDDESLPPQIQSHSKPVYLVQRVEHSDGRGVGPDEWTTFDYAGFRFDFDLRQSVGARMSRSTDAGGIVSTAIYHQAPEVSSKVESSEACDDGGCFASTETVWQDLSPEVGVHMPRPVESWSHECEGSPATCTAGVWSAVTTHVRREFTPDLAGLPTWVVHGGLDGNAATGQDNLVTQTVYASNTNDWILSTPFMTAKGSGTGETDFERLTEARLYYDTNTLTSGTATIPVRCGSGSVVCGQTGGAVVRFRETLVDDDAPEVWAVDQFDFDEFGNTVDYYDPEAVLAGSSTPTQSTVWDASDATFPTEIANALGHTARVLVNPEFGKVDRVLTPGGELKCWDYDDFGRLIGIGTASTAIDSAQFNDANCDLPLAEFDFQQIGVDPDQQRIVAEVIGDTTAAGARSLQYIDGFGRIHQEETEHKLPGGSGTASFDVVSRAWDEQGRLVCESLPWRRSGDIQQSAPVECSSTFPHSSLGYDSHGRVIDRSLETSTGTRLLESRTITALFNLRFEDLTTYGGTPDGGGAPTPDRSQTFVKDNRGQIRLNREQGIATEIDRDVLGRIVEIDGPDVDLYPSGTDRNLLEVSYYATGQRKKVSQPTDSGLDDGPLWEYEIDRNGRLVREVRPTGEQLRYVYDALGRIDYKDYAPESPGGPGVGDIDFQYVDSGPGLGLLRRTSGRGGIETLYTYDHRGLPKTMNRLFTATTPYSFNFSYDYDRHGNPTLTTLPDGGTVTHLYTAGRASSVVTIYGSELWIAQSDVHPSGGLSRHDYFHNQLFTPTLTTDYEYSSVDYQLESMQSQDVATGNYVRDVTYDWDWAGNVRSIDDAARSFSGETFEYDTYHRLAEYSLAGAISSWTYDAAGNIQSLGRGTDATPVQGRRRLHYARDAGGPVAVAAVETYGSGSWTMLADAYSYDEAGGAITRDLGDASYILARDEDGRITDVSDTTNLRYFKYDYDVDGTRIRKRSVSGSQFVDTLYVTPGYEVDLTPGNVNHKVHVFSGGIRAATLQRPGVGDGPGAHTQDVMQYHPNHLGTNEVITNGSGQIAKEAFMDPYGGDRFEFLWPGSQPGVTSAYAFTDQEADPETGLDYFGARFYDPLIGRFASQDPALSGFEGYITFDRIVSDPGQQAAYSYVGGRPTAAVDPTGMYEVGLTAWGYIEHADGSKESFTTSDRGSLGEGGKGGGGESTAPISGGEGGGDTGTPTPAQPTSESSSSTSDSPAPSESSPAQGGGSVYPRGFVGPLLPGDRRAGLLETVLGAIWSAPNAAIGLVFGGIGYGVGKLLGTNPGIGLGDGQVQFTNNPLTSTAIVFGYVGVYSSGSPPGGRDTSGATTGFAEFQHTVQGNFLGPLYLPAHGAFGTASLIHQATRGNFNIVRAWHGPANILETGPHTAPSRPWR